MIEKVYTVYELAWDDTHNGMYYVNLVHVDWNNVFYYGQKKNFYSKHLPNGHDRWFYFIALVVR